MRLVCLCLVQQGGGQLFLFITAAAPVPEGTVLLLFASPRGEVNYTHAERVNGFVYTAEIPSKACS